MHLNALTINPVGVCTKQNLSEVVEGENIDAPAIALFV